MTSVRVSEISNAYSTTYVVEAPTKEEVDVAVENLMGRYIPTGYGTKVMMNGRTNAGGFMAKVWRSNSCD